MKEFQKRILLEKRKLDEKLRKLDIFLGSDTFDELSLSEQALLIMQQHTMYNYSMILSERIRLFS